VQALAQAFTFPVLITLLSVPMWYKKAYLYL